MSRIIFRFTLVLALLLVLEACASTNAARLGTASAVRPPLLWQDVRLFRTASQVPGRYEEIALLNSVGDSAFSSEAGMFKSMQRKAGKLGANAVILESISEPSAGAKVAAAIFWVSAERKGKAVAIYIFAPDEQPTAASVAPLAPSPADAQRSAASAMTYRPGAAAQRPDLPPRDRGVGRFTGTQQLVAEQGGRRKLQCEYSTGAEQFTVSVYGSCPPEMPAP